MGRLGQKKRITTTSNPLIHCHCLYNNPIQQLLPSLLPLSSLIQLIEVFLRPSDRAPHTSPALPFSSFCFLAAMLGGHNVIQGPQKTGSESDLDPFRFRLRDPKEVPFHAPDENFSSCCSGSECQSVFQDAKGQFMSNLIEEH